MDRYLTEEELDNLEISKLLTFVGMLIDDEIHNGSLKGCTLYPPLITDGPVVNTMNNLLHENANFMYYIQIEGTDKFMQEAVSIKPLVEMLDHKLIYGNSEEDVRDGYCLDNGQTLLAINCVTTEHENKFFHIIIFLMKNPDNDEETDSELIS